MRFSSGLHRLAHLAASMEASAGRTANQNTWFVGLQACAALAHPLCLFLIISAALAGPRPHACAGWRHAARCGRPSPAVGAAGCDVGHAAGPAGAGAAGTAGTAGAAGTAGTAGAARGRCCSEGCRRHDAAARAAPNGGAGGRAAGAAALGRWAWLSRVFAEVVRPLGSPTVRPCLWDWQCIVNGQPPSAGAPAHTACSEHRLLCPPQGNLRSCGSRCSRCLQPSRQQRRLALQLQQRRPIPAACRCHPQPALLQPSDFVTLLCSTSPIHVVAACITCYRVRHFV